MNPTGEAGEGSSSKIADLERRLASVEARLAKIAPEEPTSDSRMAELVPTAWTTGLPALFGRTIMVLGGAFLLRALTESEAVLGGIGVAVGLAYALFWIGMAHRAAALGREQDATFHSLATTIIAFPMVFEQAARFGMLPPSLAALALLVFGGLLLAGAWRHGMRVLGWISVLAAVGTGTVLLFMTQALIPFGAALLLLAGASLLASYERGWAWLRWPGAMVLNVVIIVLMALRGERGYDWIEPWTLIGFQLALTGSYLGILATHTLGSGRSVRFFGVLQSLIVIAIGLEGATRVAQAIGADTMIFSLVALALSAAAFGVALLRLDGQPDQRTNYAWYAGLGALLAVLGFARLTPSDAGGVPLAVLAFGVCLLARVSHRVALRWCAAALALAAAYSSGLLTAAFLAFHDADPKAWLVFPPSAYAVGGLILAAYLKLRANVSEGRRGTDWSLPGLVLVLVAALAIGAAAVALLAPLVAGVGSEAPDLGVLSVVRTGVLVVAAVVVAWLGRSRERLDLVWTANIVLLAAGCKIGIEDISNGRPMTLFLSLALFGGALIVAPRLVRRR